MDWANEPAGFYNGVNLIHLPAAGQNAVANIVLIHGLFGHPWKTWADESAKGDEKPFWPKTLLPAAIPDARISSFGYDADVGKFMSTTGLNTVSQHGKNLVNNLADLLEATSNLPILFVVHSLGGLVLKEALNQSCTTSDKRTRSVVENTRGIVFLGTPHRGSDTASYGRIVFTLAKVFAGQSANTKLLCALEKDSETLDRVSSGFYDTWEAYPQIQIKSFFEEKETRKMGVFGMRIVSPDSARIGHVREMIGSIPADHRYMAKYSSPTDTGFREVSTLLKRWVDRIKEELSDLEKKEYQDCLDSLDDPEARERIRQVARTQKVGLDWLFSDKVPFTQWLEDRRRHFGPVFWITGKPGSGKSTAMRFTMQDPRLATALPDTKSVPYFFHLRGKSLAQKSFKGMLVELLFQLLVDKPRLFLDSRIGTLYRRLLRSHRMRKLEWDVDTLEEAILSALSPPASQLSRTPIRYIFFIDALDENANGAEHKMMLSFIRHLAIMADNLPRYPDDMIKVCLASRPWPAFQNEFGHNPRIPSFAIHEFTSGDIQSYTNQHLRESARRTSSLANYQRSMGDLAVEVCKKAHGVFVWVRLVVEELCRNLQDGSTVAMLEDVLSKLPEELQDLYEYTMRRSPADYGVETLIACQILMSSLTPLTLEALHCATLVAKSGHYQATNAYTRVAWLTSRTGGLIEEVEVEGRNSTATDTTVDGNHIVQLIHQTAEEFVRKGIPGLSTVSSQDDFVEERGSVFIFQAIATQHPPLSPLRNLARQFLHHLRTIDKIMEPKPNQPRLFRQPQMPPFKIGCYMRYRNSMFGDLYSLRAPSDRRTTTEVIDALVDYYIHPADEETLRFLEGAKAYFRPLPGLLGPVAVLYVCGVRNLMWVRESDVSLSWLLMGLVALGPRPRGFRDEHRTSMVHTLLCNYVHWFAESLGHSKCKVDILTCLAWNSHPDVNDNTRLQITKLIVDAPFNLILPGPPGTWLLCLSHTGGWNWTPGKVNPSIPQDSEMLHACGYNAVQQSESQYELHITLREFCVRFKSKEWVDAIPIPPMRVDDGGEMLKQDWWVDLPEFIMTRVPGALRQLKPTIYAALSDDEENDYSASAIHPVMALVGLVMGSFGFPELFRATYRGQFVLVNISPKRAL